MKIRKIRGWHRYKILADDGTPVCYIEMTPATTDEEKERILSTVRKLTMRAGDGAEVCAKCGFPPYHHEPSNYVRSKTPRV